MFTFIVRNDLHLSGSSAPVRSQTVEEVWPATLAKDIGVLDEDVKFVLNSQGLGSWLSRQDGWDLVTTKDPSLLSKKLLDIGVDPESLRPMQALVHGAFRTVRQFRDAKAERDRAADIRGHLDIQ